jgi:hypothetical protein
LRLREHVDHRARNADLMDKLAAHFAGRREAMIVDLGAGLGSNLRGTFAALPTRQHWILVDDDPMLLAAASEAVATWSDSARPTTSGVEAVKGKRSLHVELRRHDLAAEPAAWRDAQPDLITAAALFDLVSANWIEHFVSALARSRSPFYTTLTHDGITDWEPPHPHDRAMHEAFEAHFGRDKGFGPSAGGRAIALLAERLRAVGYVPEVAPSPWVLGASQSELIAAFARGWANAVRETGAVPDSVIADWLAARQAGGVTCTVGHQDLLALPR